MKDSAKEARTESMRLMSSCISQLASDLNKYCKNQQIELPTRNLYYFIRRNLRVNPVSKLLKTYENVVRFGLTEETAEYIYYLRSEILTYFFLGPMRNQEAQKAYKAMFFEQILRKAKDRSA